MKILAMVKLIFFTLVFPFCFIIGCVSTAGHIDASKIKSHTELSELDIKLWEQSDIEVQTLKKSGLIYNDKRLDKYLNQISKKLIPDSVNKSVFDIHVYVIRDPELNAFALPNGSIFVHLGLLARMENESQLALIVGHEIVHVLKRHSAHSYSQINNTSGFLQVLSIATAIGFGTSGGNMAGFWNGLAQSGLELTAMASVSGFGRSAEEEADIVALDYMESNNYNLHEAPRVFEIFLKEYDDPNAVSTFFYGNHPLLKQRVAYLSENIAKRNYKVAPFDSSHFDSTYLYLTGSLWHRMPGLWLSNNQVEKAVNESKAILAFDSTNTAGHYWLAKSILSDTVPPDSLEMARNELLKTIHYDRNYTQAYRELGNFYDLKQDTLNAIHNYQKYLSLSKRPKDKRFIKNKLKMLGVNDD